VFVDPNIGTREAARRRDFTINAMMLHALSGELVDHFGGKKDLTEGVLRHVDGRSFGEDPLRVLRAAQFAARFWFLVAPETKELCGKMDLAALPRERIMGELEKALSKAQEPSRFFTVLREMGQLDTWFPELKALIGIRQDPSFHGEGDVWTHTMLVLNQAALFRDKAANPMGFMLAALCHDLGKAVCTTERNGRIHAYGHEEESGRLAAELLGRLTGEKELLQYVVNLVELHMKPNGMAHDHSSVKATNRMFDRAVDPKGLIYLAIADSRGMQPPAGDKALRFLLERLKVYEDYMAQPFVTGRDLVEAGVAPGEKMGELLAYAHKLRLAGVPKDDALKQTLGMVRCLGKKEKQMK
jgi:tRNA nucleotidyltransferase (CCA-adding enzyme)